MEELGWLAGPRQKPGEATMGPGSMPQFPQEVTPFPRVLVSASCPPSSPPPVRVPPSAFSVLLPPQSCWALLTWDPLASEFWVELAKGEALRKEIGGQEGGTDGAPAQPTLTVHGHGSWRAASVDGDSSLLMLTLGA